jgi:type IV pilus assembly protein PilB
LNQAIESQKQQEKDMRLGEILLKDQLVSKSEIGSALEQIQGVAYAECPPASVDQTVLSMLPQSIAVRCCAMPLEIKGSKLVVAMAEPQNLALLDELRFRVGMPITPRFSFRDDILESIERFYGGTPADYSQDSDESLSTSFGRDEEAMEEVEFIATDDDDEVSEVQKELRAGRQRTPAVRYLTNIMIEAVEKGASDIHVEPRGVSTIVRIRVDGILRELMTMPAEHHASLVSRIKILANMDISERRIPQDGRFMMQHRSRRLDLRISTLPMHYGEKVVIRVLDPRSTTMTLDQLGFSDRLSSNLKRILSLPQGMLLVTGPTGSGKSTTLYASLNLMRSPKNNIVTVEDPVEFILDGVNQVQVQVKAGLTFASCLPSILRQDPDVIMVGEIRNGETAEIAMNASQTGHLVLSTLHTNDSVAAVTRLVDLGVPAYLIAASVTGILAQRLVRRLCVCRSEMPASAEYTRRLEKLGVPHAKNYKFEYTPKGCPVCENTGYKGRVGIYELLLTEGAVREAIHMSSRSDEILGLARAAGFRSLQEDSLEKVQEGKTTLEEIQRVVPWDGVKSQICQSCKKEIQSSSLYCSFCGVKRPGEKSAKRSEAPVGVPVR